MIELDNHKRTLIDNNKGTNIHTKKKNRIHCYRWLNLILPRCTKSYKTIYSTSKNEAHPSINMSANKYKLVPADPYEQNNQIKHKKTLIFI